MTTGVVAGKFWPYHKGHSYLLHRAARQVQHLDIILVGRPHEFPTPVQRMQAIYEDLAGFKVRVHIIGDIETNDGTDESSEMWAQYTPEILGYIPDVVFSSEDYGVRWARYMNVSHVMIDKERSWVPISGTKVRENFAAASEFLPPATKAQVLPRVVVLGSESSGTSTLANALGEHYRTAVVPEFGRTMAENHLENYGEPIPVDGWTEQMFRVIAHGQNASEERLARTANGLLICDTDSLATAVWWERYNQKRPSTYFDKVGIDQAEKHDLYIVTDYRDVPWEDDGTRDGENERGWMQESFIALVKRATKRWNTRWMLVSGTHEERLAAAVAEIDAHVLQTHAYGHLTSTTTKW